MSNIDLRTHQSYPERLHDNLREKLSSLLSGEVNRVNAKINLMTTFPAVAMYTDFVVPFDDPIIDNNNIYNIGTNEFVLPVDGEYALSCNILVTVLIPNPLQNVHSELKIFLNGSLLALSTKDMLSPGVGSSTNVLTIYHKGTFNTGDIIQFRCNISGSPGNTGTYQIVGPVGFTGPTYSSVRQIFSTL